MKVNVFVHTIEDVEYFYEKLYEDRYKYVIYTTHAGVYEYIKRSSNIDKMILSELVSQEIIIDINNKAIEHSNRIVNNLDKKYASLISKAIGIKKMNFFIPLYSYTLPRLLSGLMFFKEMILKLDNGNRNIVFEYKHNIYKTISLKNYLNLYAQSTKIEWYESNKVSKRNKYELLIKFFKNLPKAYNLLIDIIYEYFAYKSNNETTILYMQDLYDLEFIKRLNQFRLITYSHQGLNHKFAKSENKHIDINISNIFKEKDALLNLIIKNFLNNSRGYFQGLNNLKSLIKSNNINMALWGNPPIIGFKSLFYEYCKIENIKTVGMQHGGTYISQNKQNEYSSDYARCSHYISYGFTKEDLNNNFKDYNNDKISVYPFGTTKTLNLKDNISKKKIDILFPVTNSISMLEGGLIRVKPDILHKDQINILNLLETKCKNSLTCIVKPMKNTNIWQTSVFMKLQKMKYVKVEFEKTLIDILSVVTPKCVIIEYNSTPLYEILELDVDIFLFNRSMDNLTKKAEEMLNKRVYIVRDFEDFSILFEKYIQNYLPKKRDDSFYKYYINKKDTKLNIINLLNNID